MKKLLACFALLMTFASHSMAAERNIIRSAAPILLTKIVSPVTDPGATIPSPEPITPAPVSAQECLDTAYWLTYGAAYGTYSGVIRAITWSTTGDVLVNSDLTNKAETFTTGGYQYVRKDKYLDNGSFDYYHVCRQTAVQTAPVVTTPVQATGQEECTPTGSSTAIISWIAMGTNYGTSAGTVMMVSWISQGDVVAQADMSNPIKGDSFDKDGYRYTKKAQYMESNNFQYFRFCRTKL